MKALDFIVKEKEIVKYGIKARVMYLDCEDWKKLILANFKFLRFIAIYVNFENSRFKCKLCNNSFKLAFAIIKEEKFKQFRITNWFLICEKCLAQEFIRLAIKIKYNLDDLYYEIFENFINTIKRRIIYENKSRNSRLSRIT